MLETMCMLPTVPRPWMAGHHSRRCQTHTPRGMAVDERTHSDHRGSRDNPPKTWLPIWTAPSLRSLPLLPLRHPRPTIALPASSLTRTPTDHPRNQRNLNPFNLRSQNRCRCNDQSAPSHKPTRTRPSVTHSLAEDLPLHRHRRVPSGRQAMVAMAAMAALEMTTLTL